MGLLLIIYSSILSSKPAILTEIKFNLSPGENNAQIQLSKFEDPLLPLATNHKKAVPGTTGHCQSNTLQTS